MSIIAGHQTPEHESYVDQVKRERAEIEGLHLPLGIEYACTKLVNRPQSTILAAYGADVMNAWRPDWHNDPKTHSYE